MRTPRVSRFVHEHPWAILPERLETLLAILDRHDGGVPMAADVQAAIAAARRPEIAAGAGVGVLPLFGTIFPRANMLTEMSGAVSMEAFSRAVRAMTADASISAIILDVDSPGGSVFGVEEAAAALQSARAVKPVVAVANPFAASAAYWLASQASELVVVPGGQVGSIGVLAVHDDQSQFDQAQGVSRSYVYAGKYKVEGHEHAPLDDEARASIQTEVNAYYDVFVKAVAAGRKVSQKDVRAGFGEGRMVRSEPAVAAGMADRIDTLDATITRLTGKRPRSAVAADSDTTRRRNRAALAARGIPLTE